MCSTLTPPLLALFLLFFLIPIRPGRSRSTTSRPRGTRWAAPGWAGTHTEYISHDVDITGREAAVGGPWLDVERPPGTEVTLTLRLRVRFPSARTPWDRASWESAPLEGASRDTARREAAGKG